MNMKDYYKKVIIAIDCSNFDEIKRIYELTSDKVEIYKLGYQTIFSQGFGIIDFFNQKNKMVFLDLKLADIPNTNVNGIEELIKKFYLKFLTIHILTGAKSLKGCVNTILKLKESGVSVPDPVAVTVLTSLEIFEIRKIFNTNLEMRDIVRNMINLGLESGINHFVCSPLEIEPIKNEFKNVKLITPGIRPAGHGKDDQQRIMTPLEAINAGADYIVIGRPITKASDIRHSLLNIFN